MQPKGLVCSLNSTENVFRFTESDWNFGLGHWQAKGKERETEDHRNIHGERAGNRQKTKAELTGADTRTCLQQHCPTNAALHNQLQLEQQQDWGDAAEDQLWEQSTEGREEQGQAACAAFQATAALPNSAALSSSREESVQGNQCPS